MCLNILNLSTRLIWHFDLSKFRPNEVKRVKISLACVFAFMAIGWPLIILKTGIVGWINYWLMPWLGYHFWVTLPPGILCFYFEVLFDNVIFKLKFWFIFRWVLSLWCIIRLLTFLSNLRMSGMQPKPSLMGQFIVITLNGNKCDLL